MNQPVSPRRLVWLGVLGGVLLLGILFVSVLAPGAEGGYNPDQLVSVDVAGDPATDSDVDAGAGTQPFSLGSADLVSLAWRLALVIVVIAVSIAGLRWWARRTSGPRSGTGFLRVVDTLAVGNGRTIHLVALGDRVIVVGATQQNIAYLNELTAEETLRVMAAAERPADEALSEMAAGLVAAFRGASRTPSTRRHDAALERPS